MTAHQNYELILAYNDGVLTRFRFGTEGEAKLEADRLAPRARWWRIVRHDGERFEPIAHGGEDVGIES